MLNTSTTFDRSPVISGDHRPRRFNLEMPNLATTRTTGLQSGGSENLPNLEMRMHSCVEFCRAGGRHNECMGCSETGVVTGFAVWIVRVICAACIPVLAAFPTPFLKYQS